MLDVLLLLMVLIWGTNYSIVKAAFDEIDPQAFNALRMLLASLVFGVTLVWVRRPRAAAPDGAAVPGRFAGIFYTPAPITRQDWLGLLGLGIVGHFFYQFFFIGGLARTTVANSSLMLAFTPVMIALVSAALGQDRVTRLHWVGAALSMAGIYIVVAARADPNAVSTGSTLVGDLMMFVAVCCWASYTLGARRLMVRHSPVGVTGLSMVVGTVLYVAAVSPHMLTVEWSAVSVRTWMAVLYSALFALCVAYTIWYMAVQQIGSARTSVYSNLVPIVAMVTAVVFIGESLTTTKIVGAAAVLLGVALTRVRTT
jgi:drug/metabolite transporter (DMT)-like permease